MLLTLVASMLVNPVLPERIVPELDISAMEDGPATHALPAPSMATPNRPVVLLFE
jgi:hypothetical protein